jgi:hypothetical protein
MDLSLCGCQQDRIDWLDGNGIIGTQDIVVAPNFRLADHITLVAVSSIIIDFIYHGSCIINRLHQAE